MPLFRGINRIGRSGWLNVWLLAVPLISLSGCATCTICDSRGQVCSDGTCGLTAVPVVGSTCGCSPSDSSSCQTCPTGACGQPEMCGATLSCPDPPRELRKVSLPEYYIEPPDILLIEAVSHLRAEHAPVRVGETLLVQVKGTIPFTQQDDAVSAQFKQINGYYVVGADGYLNLGPEYGKVLVADQPLAEIQRRVDEHLRNILTNPLVLVTLPRPDVRQYVAGQHLVRSDGTVGLGIYGSVYVTGMTLREARCAVEQHLSQYIQNPEVSVDVLAYNSKLYYVITDGGGAGEQVYRLPCTGNETVLDAIAQINGLPTVASKGDIWLARPAPGPGSPDQIMNVDWNGIVQGAQTDTNYQVLPGDRIYVKADKLIAFDTGLAKITAPFERLLGFTILGNGTVRTLQRGRNGASSGGGF